MPMGVHGIELSIPRSTGEDGDDQGDCCNGRASAMPL